MIPRNEYRKIVRKIPILCVDMLIEMAPGEYFLVKRRNYPLKGLFWIPGGRVLKGEMMEAACKRKAKEETGLDIQIVKELGYYEEVFEKSPFGIPIHTLSVVFLARPISSVIKLDSQSSDFKIGPIPRKLKNIKPFQKVI